jgi:beta-glucosidase
MLEGNYHGSSSKPISILSGIRQAAGPGVEITFAMGSPITTKPGAAPWSGQDNATKRSVEELKAEALAMAAKADVIVYVGGITAAQEGESFDRDSIELPAEQTELIKALHATGKPIVMVNCSGSAVALPWEAENLPAILQTWYPGQNGGRAVAEVLFGDVNPSGHLPVTFYRATSDLPSFTDYSMKNRTYRYFEGKPLWAFGHGLSYTTFEYSNGKLDTKKIAPTGTLKATLTVKNAGARDGDDVVQLYYRQVNSTVPQPKLALCGFNRVSLKKGASQEISIEVPAARLRQWGDATKQYEVVPGAYELLVGAASDDIRMTLPFTVTGR